MKLIKIIPSTTKDKKLTAIFLSDSGTTIIHFGSKGSQTFLDHLDEVKKENYIKRHQVREDWTNPYKAGTLARYILWNKPTIKASIADYKKRFNL